MIVVIIRFLSFGSANIGTQILTTKKNVKNCKCVNFSMYNKRGAPDGTPHAEYM